MTKQGSAILDIIQNSTEHLTAEQIYMQAKQSMPSIVMATVYNNLNSMVEKEIIRRVRIPGQADRFDKMMNPHEHLICKKCGKVLDIQMGDILAGFEEKSGVHVESYDLSLYFVCEDCRKEQNNGQQSNV